MEAGDGSPNFECSIPDTGVPGPDTSGDPKLELGERVLRRSGAYVDPAFLDVFTFPLAYGDRRALEDPHSAIVSVEAVRELSGERPLSSVIGSRVAVGRLTWQTARTDPARELRYE